MTMIIAGIGGGAIILLAGTRCSALPGNDCLIAGGENRGSHAQQAHHQ
jgi:hypothetical protein